MQISEGLEKVPLGDLGQVDPTQLQGERSDANLEGGEVFGLCCQSEGALLSAVGPVGLGDEEAAKGWAGHTQGQACEHCDRAKRSDEEQASNCQGHTAHPEADPTGPRQDVQASDLLYAEPGILRAKLGLAASAEDWDRQPLRLKLSEGVSIQAAGQRQVLGKGTVMPGNKSGQDWRAATALVGRSQGSCGLVYTGLAQGELAWRCGHNRALSRLRDTR